eukprot:5847799-Prymnesium_polylepis.1
MGRRFGTRRRGGEYVSHWQDARRVVARRDGDGHGRRRRETKPVGGAVGRLCPIKQSTDHPAINGQVGRHGEE